MNVLPRNTEDENDDNLSGHELQNRTVVYAPQYLEAPRFPPPRSLSPDNFSNLSIEEYQQLHETPKVRILPQPSTWRGRCRAFYYRNLGLLYMLIAQLFGTMMNVTTRFLEIEGNEGSGLHPFQVAYISLRPSRIQCLYPHPVSVSRLRLRYHARTTL